MQVLCADSDEEMGCLALRVLQETLLSSPAPVVSLTTGYTLEGLYAALRQAYEQGGHDLSGLRVVSSEEYLGVGSLAPISLYAWLCRSVLEPCRVNPSSVLRLVGDAPDPDAECRRFDAQLAAWGGVDLVVQTVGANGHFGFNEPGCRSDAPTRVVALTPATRESNAAYWRPTHDVPSHGMTMGVAPTIQARHVLLLARGEEKARALQEALCGPIDGQVPCSLLRLAPRLTVIADKSARQRLDNDQ